MSERVEVGQKEGFLPVFTILMTMTGITSTRSVVLLLLLLLLFLLLLLEIRISIRGSSLEYSHAMWKKIIMFLCT